MRPSHTLLVVFAVTFLSSSHALSTTETVTKSKNAIISGTSLEALRSLRGIQTDDDGIVHTHKTVNAEDDGEEERVGGWLSKFRYKSDAAHGAENPNEVTIIQKYVQENQNRLNHFLSNEAKRNEAYSVWKTMNYKIDDVKEALKSRGISKKDYKAFVEEYKNFKLDQ